MTLPWDGSEKSHQDRSSFCQSLDQFCRERKSPLISQFKYHLQFPFMSFQDRPEPAMDAHPLNPKTMIKAINASFFILPSFLTGINVISPPNNYYPSCTSLEFCFLPSTGQDRVVHPGPPRLGRRHPIRRYQTTTAISNNQTQLISSSLAHERS